MPWNAHSQTPGQIRGLDKSHDFHIQILENMVWWMGNSVWQAVFTLFMKRQGTSIIFINDNNEILLFLRDDKPSIPFPNMWDIPGGHVEEDETPEQCIVREMKEEMELDIKEFALFSVNEFSDRIEYTFWKRENLDINRIRLHEGQYLKWFTEKEIENEELAMGFNQILRDFFTKAPFQTAPPSGNTFQPVV